MTALTLRAHGSGSPDRVWERYADPAQWAQWSPQVRRVESSAGRIAPGVNGLVIGPLGLRATFDIDVVDEAARSWSWRVRLGPARLRLGHTVAAHPQGTATTLTLVGPAPVVLAYAPIARLAIGRLVRP